jgi:hypothetical protein
MAHRELPAHRVSRVCKALRANKDLRDLPVRTVPV